MSGFFAKNVLWNGIYQLSAVIAGFLVPRSIIAAYGSQVNGLISSLTQMIGCFALVEAGISGAATFALYRPLATGDWENVNKIASASKRFYRQSGALFLVLLVALSVVYPLFVACEGLSAVEVTALVFLLGTKATVDFFSLSKYRVFLTADKKNWLIQLGSTVYTVLNTAVIVTFSHIHAPVGLVYALATLAVFARSVILAVYTRKTYPLYDCNRDFGDFRLPQRWDALFLQVLGAIQSSAPILLATVFVADLAQVSVLSVYLLVATGMQTIPAVLGTGMQASFGRLIASGKFEELRARFDAYRAVVYATLACVVGSAISLALPFVDLYAASASDADYHNPILCLLVIANVWLFHAKTPQGLLVIAAGMYRQTRLQTTVQALIVVGLGVPLAMYWGICGAMLASCISNLYRTVDLLVFSPRNITHDSPGRSFRALGLCLAQTALVALPCAVAAPRVVSWADWFVIAFVQVLWAVFAVWLVLYLADRPNFHAVFKRLLKH